MEISPAQSPLVSIIIPVKNGERTLGHCLRSIGRSYYKNFEVLVVDDHSTDSTREVASQLGASVLTAENGAGANFARNLGAGKAKGEILIFLDSDILVKRETILGIVETLEEGSIDAVVGLYSAKHRREPLVSEYKNLWVRYSYIKSPAVIDWLFGAISGIRREAFEKLGGFDVNMLTRQVDDVDLGKRFAKANLNIELNMEIEVEHMKIYTLSSFVKNEFQRSYGFAKLATKLGEASGSLSKGFANVYPEFIISTVFSMVIVVIVAGAATRVLPWWVVASFAGAYLVLNIRFLNYLEQVRGLFAMIVMLPILFLDHLVCLAGSVFGVLASLLGGRKPHV
jgi:glycosyltransferase involved in cell wall biosynthesis